MRSPNRFFPQQNCQSSKSFVQTVRFCESQPINGRSSTSRSAVPVTSPWLICARLPLWVVDIRSPFSGPLRHGSAWRWEPARSLALASIASPTDQRVYVKPPHRCRPGSPRRQRRHQHRHRHPKTVPHRNDRQQICGKTRGHLNPLRQAQNPHPPQPNRRTSLNHPTPPLSANSQPRHQTKAICHQCLRPALFHRP